MPRNIETIKAFFENYFLIPLTHLEPANTGSIQALFYLQHVNSSALIGSSLNLFEIISDSFLLPVGLAVAKQQEKLKRIPEQDEEDQQPCRAAIAQEFQQGLISSAVGMIPAITFCATSQQFFMYLFGASDADAAQAQTILWPMIVLGTPGKLLRKSTRQILLGLGEHKTSFLLELVHSGVLLIPLGISLRTEINPTKMGYVIVLADTMGAVFSCACLAFKGNLKAYPFFNLFQLMVSISKLVKPESLLLRSIPTLTSNAIAVTTMLVTGYLAAQARGSTQNQLPFSLFMYITMYFFHTRGVLCQNNCINLMRLERSGSAQEIINGSLQGMFMVSSFSSSFLFTLIFKPALYLNLGEKVEAETQTLLIIMGFCILMDTIRYDLLQKLRANFGYPFLPILISGAPLLAGLVVSKLWGQAAGVIGVGHGAWIGLLTATVSLFSLWLRSIMLLPNTQPLIASAPDASTVAINAPIEAGIPINSNRPPASVYPAPFFLPPPGDKFKDSTTDYTYMK